MNVHKQFEIRVNGKKFEVENPEINGKTVLKVAGLEPGEDYELLMKLTNKEFEPIQPDEVVDLRNEGIETFWAKPYKTLTIYIDDEPVVVKDCFMSPTQILEKAQKSTEAFYLKQILGHKEITYKNDPDHLIAIRNNLKFSTCKREPTPVS